MATPKARIPLLNVELELKWITLILMVFQNTLLVLMMRYSRVYSKEDGSLYLTSTAVVMSELFKFWIAIAGTYNETLGLPKTFFEHLKHELIHPDTIKLAVPGLLYTIQNNLLFIALSHLEAAIYQVTYQLKILTTAVFSVVLLRKHISRLQVFSLVILTAGVAAVQLSQGSPTKLEAQDTTEQNPVLGLVCVLLACCSSGFAGVYFEKILKQGRKVSLFVRNIQLSIFGVSLGLFGVLAKDYEKVVENGFFQGYTNTVWATILIQAGSGFVIASVMKYADNILKGFATAISIILSSVISIKLFDFDISALFVFGVILVSLAVFLYGYKRKKVKDEGEARNPLLARKVNV
mmetsp:Transcript_8264/g.10750  ORF Transcript_8264/g.10750 Transcript_8264/m.10750 type:complete len:350 (+) Transcript_8264:85-1134(+)